MLKRFASLGLALVLTGALAACGNNNGTDVGRVGVDWTGNDINVEAVADPEIKGVVCHVAYFNRSLIDRLQQGSGKMSLSVVPLTGLDVTWTNGAPKGSPAAAAAAPAPAGTAAGGI